MRIRTYVILRVQNNVSTERVYENGATLPSFLTSRNYRETGMRGNKLKSIPARLVSYTQDVEMNCYALQAQIVKSRKAKRPSKLQNGFNKTLKNILE